MKTVLIVSNEEYADKPEIITGSADYGLPAPLFNIENLVRAVKHVSNHKITIIHHTDIEKASEINPDYLILSGRFSPKALTLDEIKEEYRKEISFIKQSDKRILGICLGMQLISISFDDTITIEKLPEGEFGFTDITILKTGKTIKCMELHRCVVDHIPSCFNLIACSDKAKSQFIAHINKPIYGTQFHPEITNGRHKAGLEILKRFLV